MPKARTRAANSEVSTARAMTGGVVEEEVVVLISLAVAVGEGARVAGRVGGGDEVVEEVDVDDDIGVAGADVGADPDPARLYVAPFKSRSLRISKEPLLKNGAPVLRVGPCWRTKLLLLKALSKSRGTSAEEVDGAD